MRCNIAFTLKNTSRFPGIFREISEKISGENFHEFSEFRKFHRNFINFHQLHNNKTIAFRAATVYFQQKTTEFSGSCRVCP